MPSFIIVLVEASADDASASGVSVPCKLASLSIVFGVFLLQAARAVKMIEE